MPWIYGNKPVYVFAITDGKQPYDPPQVWVQAFGPTSGAQPPIQYIDGTNGLKKDSTGAYEYAVPAFEPGDWTVRGEARDADGLLIAADEQVFTILRSKFYPDV